MATCCCPRGTTTAVGGRDWTCLAGSGRRAWADQFEQAPQPRRRHSSCFFSRATQPAAVAEAAAVGWPPVLAGVTFGLPRCSCTALPTSPYCGNAVLWQRCRPGMYLEVSQGSTGPVLASSSIHGPSVSSGRFPRDVISSSPVSLKSGNECITNNQKAGNVRVAGVRLPNKVTQPTARIPKKRGIGKQCKSPATSSLPPCRFGLRVPVMQAFVNRPFLPL